MTALSEPLLTAFISMLIDTLAVMVPGGNDDADTKEAHRNIARLLFEAFQPRDAIEAMAAARAVAAHHAAMDSFTRAAQPGASDEKVIRLRANALAAGRSVEAALRARDKRRKEHTAAEAQAAAQPQTASRHVSPSWSRSRCARRRGRTIVPALRSAPRNDWNPSCHKRRLSHSRAGSISNLRACL